MPIELVHTMIRILDEERSLAFYGALGFEERGRKRVGNDTATIIFLGLPGDGDRLELTLNDGRTEPYEQGEAYGHIALTVSDMDAGAGRAWPSAASTPRGRPTPPTRAARGSASCATPTTTASSSSRSVPARTDQGEARRPLPGADEQLVAVGAVVDRHRALHPRHEAARLGEGDVVGDGERAAPRRCAFSIQAFTLARPPL